MCFFAPVFYTGCGHEELFMTGYCSFTRNGPLLQHSGPHPRLRPRQTRESKLAKCIECQNAKQTFEKAKADFHAQQQKIQSTPNYIEAKKTRINAEYNWDTVEEAMKGCNELEAAREKAEAAKAELKEDLEKAEQAYDRVVTRITPPIESL